MFSYIQKLQQKPRETKKKIALGIAFSVTAILFLFWLSAMLSADTPTGDVDTEKQSPFSILGERLQESFISIKDILKME